jgi:hypothetical protein
MMIRGHESEAGCCEYPHTAGESVNEKRPLSKTGKRASVGRKRLCQFR